MIKLIGYIKSRLSERSTWMFMSGGIAGAAALVSPFSWIVMAVGVIAALVPDGGMHNHG